MRLKTKLLTGCVFLIGIGGGMIVAAFITWRVKFRAAEEGAVTLGSSTTAIEKTIRKDEKLMTSVENLGDIPEIREALLDPEIVEALEKKEYFKLLNNEKFRKLMRHPAMKELSSDVIKQYLTDWLKKSPTTSPPAPEHTPSSAQ